MKIKSIIKNKKAVSAPVEFLIAFSILLIGLSFLYISINTVYLPYEIEDQSYYPKAIEISDVLVGVSGQAVVGGRITSSWEDYYYGNNSRNNP